MKTPRIFRTKKSFRDEFKRQIRFALTSAIGFTIAFVWRDAIFQMFSSFTSRILDIAEEHYTTKIYTAVIITLLGALLIIISSKLLKEKK